jgi:hypothetical protein
MTITYLQKKFVAPALSTPPVEYDFRREDQLIYQLRLYFNLLDNFLASLATTAGGANLAFPHIAATDTTDQYAGGDDTPTLVAWNQGESLNGFTLAAGAATAEYSGIYKITYSLQLVNTATAAEHVAYVWLKVNGTNVARSTTEFTIPKAASVDSYVCAYSEVVFTLNAGDYVELYWATDKAATAGGTKGIYIYAEPAQTSPYARPAIPSALGSITFVSAITT